jgi:hypothetical protein
VSTIDGEHYPAPASRGSAVRPDAYASGDDPTEYLEIAYRVSERRFGAWPEAMREGFAAARTETTGKPVFRLETRDR